eukprot:SAG31_NODE_40082_length_283_cov_1.070652_1_plen_34_part_01
MGARCSRALGFRRRCGRLNLSQLRLRLRPGRLCR